MADVSPPTFGHGKQSFQVGKGAPQSENGRNSLCRAPSRGKEKALKPSMISGPWE
jgi:hypothetical protein